MGPARCFHLAKSPCNLHRTCCISSNLRGWLVSLATAWNEGEDNVDWFTVFDADGHSDKRVINVLFDKKHWESRIFVELIILHWLLVESDKTYLIGILFKVKKVIFNRCWMYVNCCLPVFANYCIFHHSFRLLLSRISIPSIISWLASTLLSCEFVALCLYEFVEYIVNNAIRNVKFWRIIKLGKLKEKKFRQETGSDLKSKHTSKKDDPWFAISDVCRKHLLINNECH